MVSLYRRLGGKKVSVQILFEEGVSSGAFFSIDFVIVPLQCILAINLEVEHESGRDELKPTNPENALQWYHYKIYGKKMLLN